MAGSLLRQLGGAATVITVIVFQIIVGLASLASFIIVVVDRLRRQTPDA